MNIINHSLSSADYQIDPGVLISLMFDIANYSFFILFIILIFRNFNYNLSNKLYYFIFASLLTPFLFNQTLFNWDLFPDQSNYLYHLKSIRNSFDNIDNFRKGWSDEPRLVGFIYNFLLPFPETFRSIGFLNRFLFIILICFLYTRKHISLNVFFYLAISPSLMLYTSISLRESLILLIFFLIFYFLLYKRDIFIFLNLLIIVFFVKPHFSIFIALFYFLSLLNNKKFINYKNLNFLLLSSSFILIAFFLLFEHYFFEYLNKLRLGLYQENFGLYKNYISHLNYEFINFSNLFKELFNSIILLFLSPVNELDIKKIILFLDSLVLIYILIILIKKKLLPKHTFFFCIVLFLILGLVSLLLFNIPTMHRFKVTILFILISGFAFLPQIKKYNLRK